MYVLNLLLILCASLKFKVKGDYAVLIHVHSYNNTSSRCAGVDCGCTSPGHQCRCCDNGVPRCTNNSRCDNLFTYCLMPEGATNVSSVCDQASNRAMTTGINWNDKSIDFARDTVLGLSNGFSLPGISTSWRGAVLNVKVEDKDTQKANDLVDVFSIPISNSIVLGQKSPPGVYQGIYGLAQIELNFTVVCSDGFYGQLCNVHCLESEGCSSCLPGFTGEFCHTDIDDCLGVDCGNGECVDEIGSFRCNCTPGHTGEVCETTDYCFDNDQCVNGHCINLVNGSECVCDTGYAGDVCDTVDFCLNGHNCTSNMNCINTPSAYLCQCVPGYTGRSCEVDIDDCIEVKCPENHVCVDALNSFSCVCDDEEFTGANCTSPQLTSNSVNLGALIGGIIGGMMVLVLAALIVVVILVIANASKRLKRTVNISGKTVMMAGDNPIYALTSDVISISVPPSGSPSGKEPTNYVNIFNTQRKLESGLSTDTFNRTSELGEIDSKPGGDWSTSQTDSRAEVGSSGYENVQLHEDKVPDTAPEDGQGCGGRRNYQNVVTNVT